MGMQEYPNSGYVVKALDLLPLVPEEQRELFEQLVCDCDTEDAKNLLFKCWNQGGDYPPILDVFLLTDEDTGGEGMENGETYVQFDEDDLFVKTPSIAMEYLTAKVPEPQLRNWSKWG